MRYPTPSRVLPLATLVALATAPLGASVRTVQPIGFSTSAQVEKACATPSSPACRQALDVLAHQAAFELQNAASRPGANIRALAHQAADSAYVAVRIAAAVALASAPPSATDTPVLAELADDPVPAVRSAALKALRGSSDHRAQLIAHRADAFGSRTAGDSDDSESPDAAPGADRLGVPIPTGAVFLFFASDPAAGRYAWYTLDPPARVQATLTGKGKGPLTPAEFKAQAEMGGGHGKKGDHGKSAEDAMPSADDMQRAMAMAEQMMKAAEGAKGKSPQEQATAMQRAALGMASFNADLANPYQKTELFGDAHLNIVPLAGGGEAIVAVYADPTTGGTGITVHRAPIEESAPPSAPQPRPTEPRPATPHRP
jgi:hypothetical protein